MTKILAVTGGTGLVGGHVLATACAAGYHVRALTRSPREPRAGVTWTLGTLAAPADLCAGADAVLHIAGVINARDRAGFEAGNVAGTASILAAAERAGVRRFVHVSSLAAREPALSVYGASKAAAEALVAASPLDSVIIRPPGVYGPGDTETLAFFRMVAAGYALLPGPGRFSLIEVGDLARALLTVAEPGTKGVHEIDDGHAAGYAHADLALAIGEALGRRPRLIRLGRTGLYAGAAAMTVRGWVVDDLPTLSFDRAHYLSHPDWVAAPGKQLPAAVWKPQVGIAEGIAATAVWYRAQGWLPPPR